MGLMGWRSQRQQRTFRHAYDELARKLDDSTYLATREAYIKAANGEDAEPASAASPALVALQIHSSRSRSSKQPAVTAKPLRKDKTVCVPFESLLEESAPYGSDRGQRDAEPGAHRMFVRVETNWYAPALALPHGPSTLLSSWASSATVPPLPT